MKVRTEPTNAAAGGPGRALPGATNSTKTPMMRLAGARNNTNAATLSS